MLGTDSQSSHIASSPSSFRPSPSSSRVPSPSRKGESRRVRPHQLPAPLVDPPFKALTIRTGDSPGNLHASTWTPFRCKASTRRLTCVDLPLRSSPSTTTKSPRFIGAAAIVQPVPAEFRKEQRERKRCGRRRPFACPPASKSTNLFRGCSPPTTRPQDDSRLPRVLNCSSAGIQD